MKLNPYKKKLLLLDPRLAEVFSRIRLTEHVPTNAEPYEALISAIAHQMVHGKAAEACLLRLELGTRRGKEKYSAKKIVERGIPMLRLCGFSNNKSRAIFELAEKKLSGVLPGKIELEGMTNEEIVKQLVPLRGVGKWTVEMYLIFALGRMDAFPVDDFGVREGYRIWKKKKVQEKPAALAKKATKWAPYGTIVALALWKLADTQNKYKTNKG
jgi:DNA-3-methyladenine glycosylase II